LKVEWLKILTTYQQCEQLVNNEAYSPFSKLLYMNKKYEENGLKALF